MNATVAVAFARERIYEAITRGAGGNAGTRITWMWTGWLVPPRERRDGVAGRRRPSRQVDLARRWGVRPAAREPARTEPGFPAPVAVVGGRSVWPASECDRWLELRGVFLARARYYGRDDKFA